jgi:hypothetical protein
MLYSPHERDGQSLKLLISQFSQAFAAWLLRVMVHPIKLTWVVRLGQPVLR